ncbi:RDD family protein [Pseudonocardiaceae bacterium YIM PH 21723]|nr:RDD family protein [Pseudonocardiaceae bacterium YIM PH 21723]
MIDASGMRTEALAIARTPPSTGWSNRRRPAETAPPCHDPIMSYPPPQPPGNPYGAPPPAIQIAGMGQRLLARIIDSILLGIGTTILSFVFNLNISFNLNADEGYTPFQNAQLATVSLLMGALTVAYEVVLIALRGATVGKMALGIRVVHADTGGLPGWSPAILRWAVFSLPSYLCCIWFPIVALSPFFDNSGRRQGWHDKAAKTLVLKAR